jgi:outer membrane lipoprotein SlyB
LNASTHSPHLDLEQLIAGVNGQAVDDQARDHLATCQHCRAEANRWNLVAGAVRALAATAPEAAPPARPRHRRPRVLASPGRRALLVGSAAAALVLAGVGYGVTAALAGHAPGTAMTTALTAVNGCAQLEQAAGTLERVNGTNLVIKTASGQPVTVTTTASSLVSVSGPLLSDITDGAPVTVTGYSSNGRITADIVQVGPSQQKPQAPPGMVAVQGTVSDASAAGFTVLTSAGTRVRVTTSDTTIVNVLDASLSQFQVGASLIAIGHAGPGRTLSAIGVVQVPPAPPAPPGAHRHFSVTVRGCSPTSIDHAITALAMGG